MKELILASSNAHKIKEIQEILGPSFLVKGIKDLDRTIDIVEDGKNYRENAFIKAREIAKYYDSYIIADDSGLEIIALPSILGIYSARFMGEDTPYKIRFKEIFRLLQGKEKAARFVCGIALITPSKEEYYVEGEIKGAIGEESGSEGFGYDPIFYPEGKNVSMADLSSQEKNEISHRGRALEKLKVLLKELEAND